MLIAEFPNVVEAREACRILRMFGLLPYMSADVKDGTELVRVRCELSTQQSYAMAAPEPYEDDFQQSSWWDEYGPGSRRDDRD